MSNASSARHVIAGVLSLGLLLASSPGRADGWQFRLPFGLSHNSAPAGKTEDQIQADYRKQADTLIDQGNQLIHEGRYQEAIAPLMQASGLDPSNAIAFNDLGAAYMGLKQYPRAAQLFQEAIDRDANYAMPYRNLGWVTDQENARAAIPYYSKAIQLAPSDPNVWQVWAWRGFDYGVCGDRADALVGLTRAIHLNPKYADAYHWRGLLELAARQDGAGYADLRRSRSLNPSLGPAIDKDVRTALAMRMTPRECRQQVAAEMPQIRRVARQGRAYYQNAYREAIRQGEPPQEARAKEQEAEDTWDKDVALQRAWDHGDWDSLDHIVTDWTPEQIARYQPPVENHGNGENGGDDDHNRNNDDPSPEPAPDPAPEPEPEPGPEPMDGGE